MVEVHKPSPAQKQSHGYVKCSDQYWAAPSQLTAILHDLGLPLFSVFMIRLLFEAITSLAFTQWCTWSDNKFRKLIAVKVLQSSLLNTTMITLKVLPLGSYALMPVPSPPFKTILELVLWNGLQSCCRITPDVVVIKMSSFQYFLFLQEQKKVTGG